MAKNCENGVFQLENGMWGYRFLHIIDGRRVSRKKITDAEGNKLKTRRAAEKARENAIFEARKEVRRKTPIVRKKVEEVFKEYCEKGRSDRAY